MIGIDITGRRYNMLVVLEKAHKKGNNQYWLVKCDCGKVKHIIGHAMVGGRTKSCGCYHAALMKSQRFAVRHNMRYTYTYNQWLNLKKRCSTAYLSRWPGRGRHNQLYSKWHLFDNFVADMGPCPDDHRLVRIDPKKPFDAQNCVWAPKVVSTPKKAYDGPAAL